MKTVSSDYFNVSGLSYAMDHPLSTNIETVLTFSTSETKTILELFETLSPVKFFNTHIVFLPYCNISDPVSSSLSVPSLVHEHIQVFTYGELIILPQSLLHGIDAIELRYDCALAIAEGLAEIIATKLNTKVRDRWLEIGFREWLVNKYIGLRYSCYFFLF